MTKIFSTLLVVAAIGMSFTMSGCAHHGMMKNCACGKEKMKDCDDCKKGHGEKDGCEVKDEKKP